MDEQRSQKLRLILVAAIAVAISMLFLSRFVLFELNLRRIALPLALALAEAIAIIGVGRGACVLLSRLLRSETTAEPKIRTDFVLGYPIFGAICFLAGLMSTNSILMAALLIAGVIGGAYALRVYTRRQTIVLALSFSTWIALAVLLTAAATSFLIAQLPAVTLDEVAYHLAVPRIWVHEGRVMELPLLSHSYFPLGVESADLPLLAILGSDGAIASHFLHFLAAIAATFLIYSWLQGKLSAGFALAGTAALVTTPALLVTAGWSWNEWILIGICVALLSELDRERPDPATVAALLAAGMMTKYSFPLFALVLLIARGDRALIKPGLIGFAAGSLFLIRNLILTGNPLAPFLGANAPEVSLFRSDYSGYVFDGALLDESLGIALIALAIGAVALLPAGRFLRWSALGLLAAVVLVALSRPSSRLLLPFLVPLAMIGLSGLLQLRQARWALVALAVLQLFVSLVYLERLQPFELMSGRVADDAYLAAMRHPFPSVLWLDSQLPAESRALVLGVQELFWFSKPVRGGGNFDSNRINAYLASPQLADNLRRDGITHVAIAGDGLRIGTPPKSRLEQERATTVDSASAINLRETLERNGALLAARGNDAVYTMR